MKPEERLKFVRSKRLCDNCLNPNHIAAKCLKQSVCSVPGCGKKHTRFIHITQKSANNETELKRVASNENVATNNYANENDCNASAKPIKTALPIVPVKVKDSNGNFTISTYALLVSGSTNSFCSKNLIDKLSLKGKMTKLVLTTLEKEKSESTCKVVSLEVMGMHSKESVNLPYVFSKPKLPVPVEHAPSHDDIARWPHLKSIDFPSVDIEEVTLLIGQDVPDALIPLEVRAGQRGKNEKWNESGFRPPLRTYRLNLARRTSWGWCDDWDDTVLQANEVSLMLLKPLWAGF